MQINNKFKTLTLCVSALLASSSVYAIGKNHQLEDIVVIAKANATASDIAGTVEIIDHETIKRSGASSVADLLKQVAGFSWTTNNSSLVGRQNIGMRGIDSSKILVLVDGERANDTDSFIGHSNYKISFVDLNSVERIEIIKGSSGSALYGSEAIGGVINIITEGSKHKNYNRLIMSTSKVQSRDGGDGKNISFTSAFGNTKTHAKISANHSNREVITNVKDIVEYSQRTKKSKTSKPGTYTHIEGQSNENIDFKLTHHINATDKIALGMFDGTEKRDLIKRPFYEIDRNKQSLLYQTKIGDLGAKFKAYQNSTEATWITAFGPGPAMPYYTHKTKDKTLSAEVFGDITNNQYLTVGVEQHKQSYIKDYASAKKKDYSAKPNTQNSIYAQDKITLGSDGTIIAGVRFDDSSQFGNGTSPALGYSHNLGAGKRLKFSYSKAFKAPNIKEADSNYSFSHHGRRRPVIYIGNSDLKPETSRNLEVALTVKADSFDYSIAIYQTKVKDLIAATYNKDKSSRDAIFMQYSNIDKATIKGFESSANIDLSDTVLLNVGYSHLKTNDGKDGKLAYRPNNAVTLKFDKTFSDSLNANLLINYIGRSVDNKQKKSKSYRTFDLTVNKNLNKSTALKFAIENLANERLDDKAANYNTILAGRKYILGLTIDF